MLTCDESSLPVNLAPNFYMLGISAYLLVLCTSVGNVHQYLLWNTQYVDNPLELVSVHGFHTPN